MVNVRYAIFLMQLTIFVACQCDSGSTEYHIDPSATTSDLNDGSTSNPYSSIMEAFDDQIRDGMITPPTSASSTSYCLKLWQNSSNFELDTQPSWSTQFATLTPRSNVVKIHMLSWDQASDAASTTNVLIYYMNQAVLWKLDTHAFELSFSYVTIRSDKMVDANWASELWRHCHFTGMLVDGQTTGTGADYNSLSVNEKRDLTLGYSCENSDGPSCTNLCQDLDEPTWGFVNVAYLGATLRMSNCLITEFRLRPTYIINSTSGGSIYLTNVDFINIEPSSYHHSGTTDLDEVNIQPAGIITSFSVQETLQDQTQKWVCSFHEYQGSWPSVAPAACGELVWNGGTVSGLNKDVNVQVPTTVDDVTPRYRGFMDVRLLRLVRLSNITFSYNTVPSITSDTAEGILNMKYIGKIEMTNCKFEYNMAYLGAVYIFYMKEFWEIAGAGIHPFSPYELDNSSDMITIDSCEFTGNTAFSGNLSTKFTSNLTVSVPIVSGLNIFAPNPVNVEIKNSSFRANNSAWNAGGTLIIYAAAIAATDYTGITLGSGCKGDSTCWKNPYMNENDWSVYYTNGFYLKLTSNTFDSNQTGNLVNIQNWANVQLTGNTFNQNGSYDYTQACTDGNNATIKQWLDQNLIQKSIGIADCSVYGNLATTTHTCTALIQMSGSIYGLIVNGATQTVSENDCNGEIWYFVTTGGTGFTFENVDFETNRSSGQTSGIFHLQHNISYNEITKNNVVIPEIKNCSFTGNRLENALAVGGTIYGEGGTFDRDGMRILIKNCNFANNEALRGSAIHWSGAALIISDSTFENNIDNMATELRGGAVYFYYTLDTSASATITIGEFSCTNCTFSNNTGDYTPDIQTYDRAVDTEAFIKWFITGSSFTGSTANKGIGSIHLGKHAFKQSGDADESYISNTTFNGITATHGVGSLQVSHTTGAFTLTDVTFDGLTSTTYSCGIQADWADDTSYTDNTAAHTYLKLKTCTIQNCNCGNFAYISHNNFKMHLITEDLVVQNNQFSFLVNDNGYLTDTRSVFTSNSANNDAADKGACYYGTNQSIARFTETTFTDNSAASKGGAIFLAVELTSATFNQISATGNSALKGGFLFAQDQSIFVIQANSDISNNTAEKGSAIFTIACDETEQQHTIQDTTLKNNTGYGFIFLIEAKVYIQNSTIQSNTIDTDLTDQKTPGMVLIFSTIHSVSNTFSDQAAQIGAHIEATSNSNFVDTGSTFTRGYSDIGAFAYVVSSVLFLTNTVIDDMEASLGALMSCINQSAVGLTNVQVTNCNALDSPALIYNLNSAMDISDSSFTNFNQTGFDIQTNTQRIVITDSNFTNGGNALLPLDGGALQLSNNQRFVATGNRFTNLTAYFGGGMYFDSVSTFSYTIGNNTFTNCTAHQGGAIYNQQKQLSLYDNFFYNNTANNDVDDGSGNIIVTGDGGAIWNDCSSLDNGDCRSTYLNNYFDGNQAGNNGGAVRWTGYEPYNLTTNNTFGSSNVAVYGNNYAAYATELVAITRDEYNAGSLDANTTIESTASERHLTEAPTMTDVASGQNNGYEMILVMRDQYGQAVKTDNVSQAQLDAAATSISLGGTTLMTAENGVYIFNDFSVQAEPGSSSSFTISTDGIKGDDIGAQQSIDIEVSLRQCVSGEIRQGDETSPNEVQCLEWAAGTYAIDVNATVCTACWEMAICQGGNTMYPDSGYWRPHTEYDGFYTCLRPESCLGHENYTNQLGQCDTGYTGNLCQSCDEDYSRTSKNTWGKCTDPSVNGVRLGAILLVVVIVIAIMVRGTLSSARKKKEAYSIYFKIFMNYVQLVVLTASFKLNWPDEVQSLLDTQESAGSVTEQLFSFDCYMMEIYPDTAVFFQKLVLILFLPVIMISWGAAVWGIIAINRRSTEVLKNQLVTTIIVLFFLAHPVIVKTMFSSFACMDIDGSYFLYEDLSIECFDETHNFYASTCALPGMLIWGIASPMLALVLLLREKKFLDEIPVKMKYGFLYIGYRKKRFIWEFVILYRKIAIVFVSVFLAAFNVPVQALTAMFILIIAFYLQEHYQPYETEDLNALEKKSIVCSGVTIYCGLYFLTDSLDNAGKLGFFCVIVIVNVYFLGTWMAGICHSFLDKGARVKPHLFRKMCPCWRSIRNRANEVIRQDIEDNMSVVPLDQMFDPSQQFELDGVDDDIALYKFIARKRAEERNDNVTELDTKSQTAYTEDSNSRAGRPESNGRHSVNRSMAFEQALEIEDLLDQFEGMSRSETMKYEY